MRNRPSVTAKKPDVSRRKSMVELSPPKQVQSLSDDEDKGERKEEKPSGFSRSKS